jgi:hypothetical protein
MSEDNRQQQAEDGGGMRGNSPPPAAGACQRCGNNEWDTPVPKRHDPKVLIQRCGVCGKERVFPGFERVP